MVLLLIVCVILPTALSAAVVDLSLGATAQYNQTLGDIKQEIEADSWEAWVISRTTPWVPISA